MEYNEKQYKNNLFSKQQFLKSKSLNWNKDVLEAVLCSERLYTKMEAEKILKMYLDGKVKKKG